MNEKTHFEGDPAAAATTAPPSDTAPATSIAPPSPPRVAIRAAAPTPKRLSRKTLMTGALALGGLIAFALVNGLSERDRGAPPSHEATALRPVTPPETVRIARAQYGTSDLMPPAGDEHDYFWGASRPSASETTRPEEYESLSSQEATSSRAQPPGPAEIESEAAHASSIAFTDFVRAPDEDTPHLGAAYVRPRSPFIVHAGATVSAALLTALNSDHPGPVIAQVSENVYDTVSGRHLLIPQGARLIGSYDADATYGDARLMLRWERLIMPNGASIELRAMPGADATGAVGVRDQVDHHVGRLVLASVLSGALSIAANEAEDGDNGRLSASVGDAAAQEAARVGARIVDRELAVHPTLRVRAGARLRVLLTQDIVLEPYRS